MWDSGLPEGARQGQLYASDVQQTPSHPPGIQQTPRLGSTQCQTGSEHPASRGGCSAQRGFVDANGGGVGMTDQGRELPRLWKHLLHDGGVSRRCRPPVWALQAPPTKRDVAGGRCTGGLHFGKTGAAAKCTPSTAGGNLSDSLLLELPWGQGKWPSVTATGRPGPLFHSNPTPPPTSVAPWEEMTDPPGQMLSGAPSLLGPPLCCSGMQRSLTAK